jgi:hypothetical protein
MNVSTLFTLPDQVTPENFEQVMHQAIALELATIPTYLSTYYSINRAQDQDALYDKIKGQLSTYQGSSDTSIDSLAQELKVDVLVYANKAAALIMSVVIEEMLHLALSSNVKQAIVSPPDLMSIGRGLSFPTQLNGHVPEFRIDSAKLSLRQLTTFLQIESPLPFKNPGGPKQAEGTIDYKTIGRMYDQIIAFVEENYGEDYTYRNKPQLLPEEKDGPPRPFYSQNSINTVHYDREHNPKFANSDTSGGLIGVHDAASAVAAMKEIQVQGEGGSKEKQHTLVLDNNNKPVPLPIVNGEVQFWPGDYDDGAADQELSHFSKFLEIYSLGEHNQDKFKHINGLDDFFSYFVYDQASNPKQADYDASNNKNLALCNQLGNALFAYILLMVETCYYKDDHTQYNLFMYGIHKSMIWLLSEVGNHINKYKYTVNGTSYIGAITWEDYPFRDSTKRPKAQIIDLANALALEDGENWGWVTKPENSNYFEALPDVGLDHSVTEGVPDIPA